MEVGGVGMGVEVGMKVGVAPQEWLVGLSCFGLPC